MRMCDAPGCCKQATTASGSHGAIDFYCDYHGGVTTADKIDDARRKVRCAKQDLSAAKRELKELSMTSRKERGGKGR